MNIVNLVYDAFVAYCAVKANVSKRMGLLFCYVGKNAE